MPYGLPTSSLVGKGFRVAMFVDVGEEAGVVGYAVATERTNENITTNVEAGGCQRKRSGSLLRGLEVVLPGMVLCDALPGRERTVGFGFILLHRNDPIVGGCSTCWETFTSGFGTEPRNILPKRWLIQLVPVAVVTESFEEEHGMSRPSSFVQRIVVVTVLTVVIPMLGFDSYERDGNVSGLSLP